MINWSDYFYYDETSPSCLRWTGKTGGAGEYYYDNETHTVHDKEDYLSSRGGEFYAN